MDSVKPILSPEEQIALSSFLTRKVKQFDAEKGPLGFWIKENVCWWFEKLAKGEMRE